jgi:hypothetical protein
LTAQLFSRASKGGISMEPGRETTKRAAAAAPKTASKKPQGQEASPSNAGDVTNQQQTGDQNQDLLQHAKQATGEIVNQVQQQAGSQIDRQKETAANQLTTVVNAVRQLGQTLSGEANGPIARYAGEYSDKAAQSLERFTNYIREQDARRLLDDVQNFGRRQPALLLGGAFLLGFAGARLIKSSMEASAEGPRGTEPLQRYDTQVPHVSTNIPATKRQSPGANVG